MAVGDENIIEEDVVKISPDLTGFRQKLEASLKEAVKGVEAKIKLVADRTGFAASIKEKVAAQQKVSGQPTYKISLRADRSGFAASIKEEVAKQQALKNQPTLKVRLVADGKDVGKAVASSAPATRSASTSSAARSAENAFDFNAPKGERISDGRLAGDASTDAAYLLRLKQKSIKDQLNLTRNGAEQVQAVEDAAHRKNLDQDIKAFGKRFQLQAAGNRATVKNEKDTEKQVESSLDTYYRELQKRFDLQRGLSKADKSRADAETSANVAKQRSDENYYNFTQKIERELGTLRENAAREDVEFARDAAKIKKGIDSEGSKQRINLLETEDKIKRKLESEAERRSAARESRGTIVQQAADLFGQQRLIDFGRQGLKPMTLLYGAAIALAPALIALASSAVQAGSSIAALGAAAIGGAAAITGVLVAFSPVVKALKLAQTVQAEGLKSAANDAATKERILDATDALSDAQRNLNKAQKDELTAQLAVNDARAQAIRDLANLKQSVIDLNNELSGDKVSLAEAQDSQAATARNFFSTRLQNLRAAQDVADARTDLSDTTLKRAQATQDLKKSVGQGIEGSDVVTKAKQSASDATANRQQAARAVTRAQRNVAQAKRVADPTSTSAAQLADQLKKMSPAARELYHLIHDNQKVFEGLSRSIQQKVLPGFNLFVRDVLKVGPDGKSSLSIFADAAGDLGGVIGDTVGKLGKLTQDKGFRSDFAKIIKNNKKAMSTLGDAVVKLATPFFKIFAASSPLLVRFANYILNISDRFAKFIDNADKNGSLSTFFKKSGDELGRWADFASQVLGFLKGLFTASVGAGGTLLSSLTTFFSDANKWANGEGQPKLKKFFDKIANLPYAKIVDFVQHMATLFAGLAGVNWSLANPFFAAFGTFAASNPAAAAQLVALTTKLVTVGLEGIAAHPKQAATLLAILSAYRFANRLAKIGITFPGIENLNKALAGKFKVLDKFLGGGATTATMTVHAGVVNVYGAGGVGTGGLPGEVPGAVPGEVAGKAPRKLTPTGAPGKGIVPGGELFILPLPNIDRFNDSTGKTGYYRDKSGKQYTGDAARAAYNRDHPDARTTLSKDQQNESSTFNKLKSADPRQIGLAGGLDRFAPLQDYIGARKKIVTDYTDYLKSVGKTKEATKFLTDETERSRTSLQTLLQQFGFSKKAAKEYADKVYGVGQNTATTAASTKDLKDKLDAAGGKADTAKTQFDAFGNIVGTVDTKTGALKGTLSAVVGGHTIAISTTGYADTKKQLDLLYATQHVLYNPAYSNSAAGADTVSSQNQYLDPKTGLPKKFGKKDGGHILGAGTALSDSIPAWLSNGEYVMPTNVVQHYGLDTMESMRRKALPKFKAGGLAKEGTWPAKVYLGPKGFQFPTPEKTGNVGAVTSGGSASGDISVARIAEETARAMKATNKELIALMEAGLVESGLRNLSYGDRDSVGFLQQRPSQGWGSAAQLQNVAFATRKFISAAKQRDEPGLTAGQLAQAVQRSARPAAYDQRLADAVAVLNQESPYLPGYSGGVAGGATGASGPLFGKWPASPGVDHGHDSGIWRKIIALVAPTGLDSKHYGSLYDNRHTDNGGWSWHSDGHAVDFVGFNQDKLAQFFEARRPAVLELIHRTENADYGVKRGQPHNMGHEFDKHRNHLHVAMNKGGPVRTYDSGGDLPPGYTLAYNGTGRTETVRTYQQEKQIKQVPAEPMRLDRRDMQTIAAYIASAASPTVQMDGREVAKITNRYTYLAAGV